MVASSSSSRPGRALSQGASKSGGRRRTVVDMGDEENNMQANADLIGNDVIVFDLLLATVWNTLVIISQKVLPSLHPPVPFSHTSKKKADQYSSTYEGGYKVLALDDDDGASGSSSSRRRRSPRIAVPQVILDSGASVHATGDRALLSGFTWIPARAGHAIHVANGAPLVIRGFGDLILDGSFVLRRVLYVPGLAKNIVSVSRLADLDYTVDFTRTGCFVRDAGTGEIVGQGRLVAGLFELDFLRVPLGRAPPQIAAQQQQGPAA